MSLTHLTFGNSFNQPIEHMKFPDSIETLVFGDSFNQPINKVRWPIGLKKLLFGSSFNQQTNTVPSNVAIYSHYGPNDFVRQGYSHFEKIFDDDFNMNPSDYLLNRHIKIIKFGDSFNQPISKLNWPFHLKTIIFGKDFNQTIENEDPNSKIYSNNVTVYVPKSYDISKVDSNIKVRY